MALLNSAHGGNIREAAAWLGIDPQQLLDFSANINPLGMPGALKQALCQNMDLLERYPDPAYPGLYQALAAHHQLPAAWLLAGNGETEVIYTLVQMLAPRRAMLVAPGFAEYRRALQQVDCQIETFLLTEAEGWQLTESILPALTAELDCLFLCTPNNPTGLMPDESLLLEIVARCRQLNIALIVDEAFLDFLPDRSGLIPHLASNPHLWVLRSLTKFYAIPGLRLGYLLNSDPQAVAQLRERQMPWTINALAALAGEVILEDKAYQQATLRWLNAERPRLCQRLRALSGVTVLEGQANYLFLRCDVAGLDLQRALLEQHVLIRSCANYPGLDERYFRVAVRSAGENDRLVEAFEQVLAV
ncbi:L-threonine O-3-phosphate decarboxylase [Enterobacter sp. BIGb0383]|uniref:threonine-phosphate decarboxylase CobD n=1 Tax=unclassified Enterobacter TaxID=2608935 RepID=UPI000F464182|nr:MULTISPECIES: threonine-phosphate decarboxylase CobD [unclassified Enterobacter]ROP59241.1 L-threonine O-3-phosphate decarboxylase [Enterobacter sp. BIGb0383]ROS09293.1 L-threonine O-3-phosphate decarboxylase [Enterobacter sp. BIGb0359]